MTLNDLPLELREMILLMCSFEDLLRCQFVELGCSVTHLALAWVAKHATTSTVILGASKPEQVLDNLKALDVLPKLTPEVLEKIEQILQNKPEPQVGRCCVMSTVLTESPAVYIRQAAARRVCGGVDSREP